MLARAASWNELPHVSSYSCIYLLLPQFLRVKPCVCVFQLFPQIEEAMVQPLRESRDRYEELKQIDDAMNEVRTFPSE